MSVPKTLACSSPVQAHAQPADVYLQVPLMLLWRPSTHPNVHPKPPPPPPPHDSPKLTTTSCLMFHQFQPIFRSPPFFLSPRSSWTIASCTPIEVSSFAPSTRPTSAFTSAWLRSTRTSPTLSSGSRCSWSQTDNWTRSPDPARTWQGSAATASSPASTTRTTLGPWAPPSALWRSTATRCGWKRGRRGAEGEAWEVANGNTFRKWRRAETGDTTEKSGGTNESMAVCWGQQSRKGPWCDRATLMLKPWGRDVALLIGHLR